MPEIVISLILVGLIVAQQIFYLRQIQKLIDKLMSRSYVEYEKANAGPQPPRVRLDDNVPEDLRPLQDFSLL